MAKNNNFSNRGTLKYEMQKQINRFDRKMQKYENATLRKKYDEAGWGSQALKDEIKKFKEDNDGLTRKELAAEIKNITNKYKENRKPIEEEFNKTYKDKLASLRNMVETTPIKYKILNDELDPGITLLGNSRKQKTPNTPDSTELMNFHKRLENDFFGGIVNAFDVTAQGKQSPTKFLKDTLKSESINYTNVRAKNVNQGPDSLINAYNKMLSDGIAVGYDLETIGATDANGIWKPRAITEYSFQTYDTNNKKVIKDVTAVMGISKEDAKSMYDEIIQAIDNGTLKDNNDLWVTANRMMKYGHEKTRFEMKDGLIRAVDFVDEDAVSNVFSKEQIWEGFKKHIDVHDNAKIINGMKDYEYYFMKTVADIKKNNHALMGFNDAFFDSPIIDSQMNMIVDKYRNNEEAINSIKNMFGSLDNVKFNPDKNNRLDLRAAINLAVDKKGYEAVYGKGYNDFLNEKALKSSMTVRQEYLVERHFNEAFNSGTAHLAVEDVRNLLRLGFEESDVLEGRTLLGDLMGIIKNEYTPDKISTLSDPEQGVQKVLFANRNSQAVNYTGRGVLGFTVDNTNGSYKTGAGFMVGNASEAIGDVSRQNIRIGGHVDKNQFYSFGGIKKMTMTDEFIKEANMHMPEYARREMYVVKLDKMVSEKYKDHEMATSTYLFFNELAEAEGQISSMFNYIGDYVKTEDGATLKLAKGTLTKDVEDIITGVNVDANGKIKANTIGRKPSEITKAFEDALETRTERTVADRARRHAIDGIYKNSKRYAKLLEEIDKSTEVNVNTKDAGAVKDYLLSVANKLSNDVSRNKILNGQDADSLVVAALGYVPKGSDKKYIYGSTLYNFIESNDIFHSRNQGINNLYDFIASKTGIEKGFTQAFDDFDSPESSKYLATTHKLEAMYDYILNKAAMETYDTPEELKRAINMVGEKSGMSKSELKSYFEFDVTGLGKEDKYIQKTINTLDNSDVLRVNLKSGDEYNLVNKVFKLYHGEFADEAIDGEVRKASAMRNFIIDMSKRNKDIFSNKALTELVEDVTNGANGGTISPQVMASRLISGLNSIKEKDFSAGIIKTDFNIASLAANDNKVMQLANIYMNNGDVLKEAYEKTSLFKNMYENDKAAIKDVIDRYFMPTFNGKTGDDALAAILGQGIYTEKQAKVITLNWNKAREVHQENIGKLFELISQGGGNIHFSNSGINIEMNGKMINFDGLAKTRYDNGTLYHQVGNSKVTAQLDLGWSNKANDFTIESNLKEVLSKSYADYNMKKINKEIDAGEFSIQTLSYFTGKVQGSALEEAVISDFNLHERNSQFRFGLGDAIGKHIEDLIGTDEAIGRWGDLKTIDKNAISRIRKIVTSDNWKNGDKSITPELKELLVKNMIPMLQQTVKNEEVLEILGMATFSNKDTQVAKASTDIHLGERYSQRWGDKFDNAQRPVTAAQKKVFKKNELEAGIAKYIEATGGAKDVHVGNIIDEASTHAMKTINGIAIDGVEQVVTYGKANVGQVGLMAIVDNNFHKIIAENNTVYKLSEEKKKAQFLVMKKKMNVYEQEKVMDARLMDSIFEMGANKQFISENKSYLDWLDNIEKIGNEKDLNMAARLADVKAQIKVVDGKIQYISSEGALVDRGEAIMKYMGFGGKETTVNSKQFMGRLQYGVFEKKGGLKLSDKEVSEFLQNNMSEIERLAQSYGGGDKNIAKASNEILSKYFKTGFYVEDIRQKTYMKVMNEGVEKDMTNGLYVGLGQLDSRIAKYMRETEYQGRKLTDFADQVLTLTEIDKIFVKNFKANDDFKTAEQLRDAILSERYYDSVSMFDIIDDFKKSSMITSHAVAKHNNSGMIFENTIGSIFSIYKRDLNGDHQKALEKLRDNLAKNDVIDMFDDNGKRKTINDVLEITKDGRLLHHTIKSNQAEMSNDMFNTIESLNVDNLINMIKNDKSLKELVHEGVKVFDPEADGKYRVSNVYGDVIKTNLKHKDGTDIKNVVIGTRAQSGAEIAIDAEYMTVYDYDTVKNLEAKAAIDRQMIDNRVEIDKLQTQKKNAMIEGKDTSVIDDRIKELEKANLQLRIDKAEVNDSIGDMLEISKGKKIGNQEFNLYNIQVMNEGTTDSISSFMRNETKGIDDEVLASLKANFSGILTESEDGTYELSEEYKGYKVLEGYMKNIKSRNMFKTTGEDTGLEVALTEDMLRLDEYKHLKETYKKVRSVADEHIGPDAKISVRYAEQAHQIESAHIAYKFNKGGGLISDATLENYGFNRININDLVVSGADAEKLKINSMFDTNYLVDLDEFGTLALPKAGKITGDDAIKETFQSTIVGIQQAIKEYRDLYTTEDSEVALAARARIGRKIDDYKDNLRHAIYDKHGMLYNAGKTEVEESFRVKSSAVSVLDSDVMGENSEAVRKSLEVITGDNESDKILLGKARINGKSIAELEKNGIYHDYIFVSSDIFNNLGYFDEKKMANYFNVDVDEVANNLDMYKGKMKEALQTHGDIFMGERYPAIWIGSDKPMRVFLDDNTTDINRARLSMATMLSMNGDNDGDSISASLLRSEKGLNFLQYQLAKEDYIANNISGSRYSDEAIAQIDAAMSERFGAEAKFFKGIEALMATESITANRNFAGKGKSDMIEELQTAVANGDLNSVKAVKFNSLYGGKLYANYGGTSSMEALTKNEEAVNDMISLANKVNAKAGNIFEMTNTKINDAGDYTTHLNDTFKIFDAMQNPNSYNLTQLQTEKLAGIKTELNITDEAINTMREDAVMRARWMDYQSETMAKARKGSIGPINVALQQHRQAVDALYDSSITSEYAQKLAVQHISKEIEQEVISSKKGNVIFNMTKTTDLIDTYRKIWNNGVNAEMQITDMNGSTSYMTARESLTNWMNENLDDKKIKSIITEIESKAGESFTREAFGATAGDINSSNIGTVRSKLTNSYIDTLDKLHESDYSKAIRKVSRQGGNLVDDTSVIALERSVNATDMMTSILTHGEDKVMNSTRSASHGVLNTMPSNSEKVVSAMAGAIDGISNIKVKGMSGLAVGALGVAAGMLVSGFAGGPIDQTSASDYAQAEESKPQAVSVPTMMDNGGFATVNSGSSGYIINVRANTNKNLTQTKKVLREAASASVGGGVNVNMNIKERSERFTERDIESMIAGIF